MLSLVTQLFATGRFLERFGCGVAAGALPAVYLVGFAVLGFSPTLAVVLVFQVAQRWANFAIANPARQVFFTVVERGEKYKAKNFIDVVVFRGSDALYGWVFDSLQAIGLKLGVVALCALPVAAGWLALSLRSAGRRSAAPQPASRRIIVRHPTGSGDDRQASDLANGSLACPDRGKSKETS